MRHWTKFSVSAIATVLFKVHDWDFDKAVCAAYWKKHGKMIKSGLGIYCSWRLRTKSFPVIPPEDAKKLLDDYWTYKNTGYGDK